MPRRPPPWLRGLAVLLLVVGTLLRAAPARAQALNLLADATVVAAIEVSGLRTLTDGAQPPDGSAWRQTGTTVLDGTEAAVVWDLGSARPIAAAYLHGDNNDRYELSVSDDNVAFRPLWIAEPVAATGLRPRSTRTLSERARYVRLRAINGDRSLAVSEVILAEQAPADWPPRLKIRLGEPPEQRVRTATLLVGAALAFLVLAAWRHASRAWLLAAAAPSVVALAYLGVALGDAWPVSNREVSLVRGVVAAVAAFAVFREVFAPPRFAAHRAALAGVLGVCAVLAVAAFYNLGRPQFYDVARGAWTPVHFLDLRQYFSTAKYFPEIGYRRMYEADVAAYAEDTGKSLDSLGRMPMRDLDDLQMKTVADQRGEVEAAPGRFSPERWAQYKADARYFRGAMGTQHYLDTMHDMGGNATPVWISIAYLLFNAITASNTSFLATGVLDPLLLLAALVAIGRTFGLRTALIAGVVFGANDFIMYGSNWGGATLRHDWLAYLGLGAAAIASGRFVLGGVLFGLSTSIRAFPAAAVLGLCIAPASWVVEEVWRTRRLPALSALYTAHRGPVRAVLAAGVTVLVLVAASSALTSFGAWVDWLAKVRTLSHDPHANHISLRQVVAGWSADQHDVLATRQIIFWGLAALYTGMVVVVARKAPPARAAIVALTLVPVYFYPANYYIHLVFLLPIAVAELRGAEADAGALPRSYTPLGAAAVLALLVLCAAQYFTVPIPDLGQHFYMAGVLLFAALLVMLGALTRQTLDPWWTATPDGAVDRAPAATAGTAGGEGAPPASERTAPDAAPAPEVMLPEATLPEAAPAPETTLPENTLPDAAPAPPSTPRA